MKMIKAIVILMGVVLVVGFPALIFIWQSKQGQLVASGGDAAPAQRKAAPPGPPSGKLGWETTVILPDGAQVVRHSAGATTLDVLTATADGNHDLYQLSRTDGAVLGVVHFRHKAE